MQRRFLGESIGEDHAARRLRDEVRGAEARIRSIEAERRDADEDEARIRPRGSSRGSRRAGRGFPGGVVSIQTSADASRSRSRSRWRRLRGFDDQASFAGVVECEEQALAGSRGTRTAGSAGWRAPMAARSSTPPPPGRQGSGRRARRSVPRSPPRARRARTESDTDEQILHALVGELRRRERRGPRDPPRSPSPSRRRR